MNAIFYAVAGGLLMAVSATGLAGNFFLFDLFHNDKQSNHNNARPSQTSYNETAQNRSNQYAYRSAKNTFVFDPKTLTYHAYDGNGRLMRRGHAVGGAEYCADVGRRCRTPVGHFKVHARRGPGCVSSKFPLDRSRPRARMPHCNFFYGGYAVHGHYDVPNSNVSHGCIRVYLGDAQWLHNNFFTYGTRVVVKPYGRAAKSTQYYKRQYRRSRNNQYQRSRHDDRDGFYDDDGY